MAIIDPTKTWELVEERLSRTTNERHRQVLGIVLEHMKAEAVPDMDRLMATLSPNPDYHFWYANTDMGPKTTEGVRAYYEAFVASGANHLVFEIDRLAVDDFLVLERPATPRRVTFCHNDLGDEHIVMGAGGAEVAGVIDWSDAILGDPARDLALLWLDFGTVVVDNVLAGYQGPVEGDLRARSWWYAAHAGVEGLTYRTRHLPHTVDEAIRRLRHVLAEGAA